MKLIRTTYFPFISVKMHNDGLQTDYIARYYLWFCQRVFINIMRRGEDVLHTHPWNYVSIILWGGYKETTIDKDTGELVTKKYGPGSILHRKHTDYHSLEMLKPKSISLFFISKIKVDTKWRQSFIVNNDPKNQRVMNDLEYQLYLCKTSAQKKELVSIYRAARDDVMGAKYNNPEARYFRRTKSKLKDSRKDEYFERDIK